MHSELSIEVGKGIEAVGIVEAALIHAVAALYLAIMTGSIWPDQFVPDTHFGSRSLKEGDQLTP